MNSTLYQLSIPYHEFLSNYTWDIWGTLTPTYKMSLASIERAMLRFEKNVNKELADNRIFWVAERFEGKGYHVHLIATFEDDSKNFTKKAVILNKCWERAIAASRRPCNKIRKYKKNDKAIDYILKNLMGRKIGYGFYGELW